MKIALIISSLRGGGAERVMATLANGWLRRGVSVTLITLDNAASDVYPLDPGVKRIALDLYGCSKHLLQAAWNNWRRIRLLRAALRAADPDVALSFLTTMNMLAVIAGLGTGIPIVVSERISVVDSPPQGIWAILFRSAYRLAAKVVALTNHSALFLQSQLKIPVQVIPNPVDVLENNSSPADRHVAIPDGKVLLAIGRLAAQKGFDLLLEAFGRLAANHPDWSLVILGEGPQRRQLEQQVAELGLNSRVLMPGFVDCPAAVLQVSEAFVLSSRYEGIPNVLLEAMASGLACVSFNCRTGPAELIEDGINGLLVPAEDVDALASTLSGLMGDSAMRMRLGREARKIKERFSLDYVLTQWEGLFACLLGERARSSSGSSSISEHVPNTSRLWKKPKPNV